MSAGRTLVGKLRTQSCSVNISTRIKLLQVELYLVYKGFGTMNTENKSYAIFTKIYIMMPSARFPTFDKPMVPLFGSPGNIIMAFSPYD